MTKEEVLKNAKENKWFLRDRPEWNNNNNNNNNNNKEVVLAVVKNSGSLYYASSELKNNKEVIIAAIQEYGCALKWSSNELKNDREFILQATKLNTNSCEHSLLKGYKTFEEIIDKEGFLFSCWNNYNYDVRLRVAKHQKNPTNFRTNRNWY